MRLPNIYGYGTLFAYSGLAGDNDHGAADFVAMTMPQPLTLRFDAADPVTLQLPVESAVMDFVLSDVLQCRQALVVFADKNTVVGRSAVQPVLFAQTAKTEAKNDLQLLCANGYAYALLRRNGRFALCRANTAADACKAAEDALQRDPCALRDAILSYYEEKPRCRKPQYERLYYKCLSVNRVNVYSPQNGFSCRYTTPDRLPHKHMWLWDSMFHAITFAQYDPQMAKEAILAVLQCQQEDGFLPHMMKSTTVFSAITQPQVVAWAALEVYFATKDKDFLLFCADKIAAFETWFLKNRDQNGNGLLEWKTDYSNVRCRCDESGMDNSPRFDTTETLDAIDASCFMVHDCRCLADIYRMVGNEPEALYALNEIQRTAALMRFELERGNVDAFAQLLAQHWELSKMIDAGSTNTLIDQIFDSIEDLIDGRMVCGAGGGGFLQVVLRRGVSRTDLQTRLKSVFADTEINVWDCTLV